MSLYEYMEFKSQWVTSLVQWWDVIVAILCGIFAAGLIRYERSRMR